MSFSIGSRSVLISWSGLLLLPMLAPLAWAEPTQEELEAASLLASRATFGMSYDQIVEMAEQGLDEWLDEQLNMECTSFVKWEKDLVEMYEDGEFDEFIDIFDVNLNVEGEDPSWQVVKNFGPIDTIWYMAARYGKDQLCQRVAWALSQIFVITEYVVENNPFAHTAYYDILIDNAFGNFRELIEDVTYSAQMGLMLSHVNNSRPRPELQRFPDENYARELMQLLSIGLFELNDNGTVKTDESEDFIPTYDGDDITNLARVLTGFAFDGESAQFNEYFPQGEEWMLPMMIFNFHHDKDEKVILGDIKIPSGQTGETDVRDALDAIHAHDNVGPFIGRQLIQRLVTSNPVPEYVRRVAEAFNDDGLGVRGNLKHVVKTILTDPEATNPSQPIHFGKLREPMVRLMNLHRMFPTMVVREDDRGLTNTFYAPNFLDVGNQEPLKAPSVFNFYSPFHSPRGDLSDNELVAPEFQIFDMLTSIQTSNAIWDRLVGASDRAREDPLRPGTTWFGSFEYEDEDGEVVWWHPVMSHDIDEYVELADEPSDLVDRLDIVMAHGTLNSETRRRFIHRIGQIPVSASDEEEDLRDRVWFAIWYMASLPDYIVETY